MMMHNNYCIKNCIILGFFCLYINICYGCTTLLVGSDASNNGNVMVTHSNDCFDCDHRIVKIESEKVQTIMPIYKAKFDFPRLVHPINMQNKDYNIDKINTPFGDITFDKSAIIGYVRTKPLWDIVDKYDKHSKSKDRNYYSYSFIEGTYGIQNSQGLSVGESTCGSTLVNRPIYDKGKALFDITALIRVGLQLCESGECMIHVMGYLATEYGYYGAEYKGENKYEESGETVTIGDKYHDAYIFSILPDGSDQSAVFISVKLNKKHYTFCTNQFTIGKIHDHDNVYHSDNMYDIAMKYKLWNPVEIFHFSHVFSLHTRKNKEPYYNRRSWRIINLLSSSFFNHHNNNHHNFPFSVKPDSKINQKQLFSLHRDYYANTSYDLTKGIAAGPYGSPTRNDGCNELCKDKKLNKKVNNDGEFERPISMFRTAYASICISNDYNPHIWFASGCPHSSMFNYISPFVSEIPKEISDTSSLWSYSADSLYWQITVVHNYIDKYFNIIQPSLVQVQDKYEHDYINEIDELNIHLVQNKIKLSSLSSHHHNNMIDKLVIDQVYHTIVVYKQLFNKIITKYHDGLNVLPHIKLLQQENKNNLIFERETEHIFYPLWYLELINYFNNNNNDHDSLSSLLLNNEALWKNDHDSISKTMLYIVTVALAMFGTFSIGLYIAKYTLS